MKETIDPVKQQPEAEVPTPVKEAAKSFRTRQLSTQFTMFIFAVLLINTSVSVVTAGYHFRNEYFTLMQSRVETVGSNLRDFMVDIMSYGLALGSLDGIGKELQNVVEGDLSAAYANVVNENSEIIYSFPESETSKTFLAKKLLPHLQANTSDTFLVDDYYNTFLPIYDPGQKKVVGGINIGISEELVLEKTYNILTILITIFAIFIAVTSLLLYVITKRAIKPLEILNKGALALGDGDLSVQVDVSAKNEIGSLANSFNIMARKLEQDNKTMKEYTITLEQRNVKLQSAQEHILQREEKLKSAQSKLVLNEKMASLGVLIAGIAHEINTPAGAVANVATDLRTKIKLVAASLIKIQEMPVEEINLLGAFVEDFIKDKTLSDGGSQWKKSREIRKWLKAENIENHKNVASVLAKYDLTDQEYLKQYLVLLQSQWKVDLLDALGTVSVGMQICESSIQKITQIVKALKYYAYTDMDQTSLIDINESIQNALLLLHNKLKYNTDVITNYGTLPQVHCNSEINQVWTNLVGNAFDAAEMAGEDTKNKIVITTELVDDNIVVSINDNGTGIKDLDKEKMFDPFYTTKGIGKGTGLGLSIVSGIVKKHEGTIDVESEPGNTTFTISMPAERRREERTDDQAEGTDNQIENTNGQAEEQNNE